MIGFHKGLYLQVDALSLPITATTINRSYAAFEFFTVINSKPFYLDRHLKRLFTTLNILRISINYTESELTAIIHQLINQNQEENTSFKLFVIPEPDNSYQTFKGELFIFPVLPEPKKLDFKQGGEKLILRAYSRFLPEAKTTNYIAHIYWEKEVQAEKAIDVLYHQNKNVTETSRSNLFMVKNNTLYTPSSDILKGITRSIVIDLIHQNNLQLKETNISLATLLRADELFITSTTRAITPITQIDNFTINQGKVGEITRFLKLAFENLKENYI